jgi:hypothetical protein
MHEKDDHVTDVCEMALLAALGLTGALAGIVALVLTNF